MRKIYIRYFRIALIIAVSGIMLMGCGGNSMKGWILFTQVTPAPVKVDAITGGNWRFVGKSRIVAVNPAKPGMIAKVLTKDFYAARSPEVSFDGKKMLFAGQKNQGDLWQIYEMTLGKNDARQVIKMDKDCTDPAYLADGKIIFSSLKSDINFKSGSTMYTCGADGCCLSPITYHPNADFASSMLQDGRVVMITWQLFPEREDPEYMVIRPDGTKAELYYRGQAGTWLNGKIHETPDGHVIFVESGGPGMEDGKLISLKSSRPLSSRSVISDKVDGSFYSVCPEADNSLLVSYRNSDSRTYGIYEYNPQEEKMGTLIFSDKDFNCIEPVVITDHQRPKDLPTELSKDKHSGLLMCMNSDYSTLPVNASSGPDQKAKSVRILGLNGLIKEIPVAEDGSFYVNISSDIPVRFETVNSEGRILRGPSDWIWMRPNERRGCIGCHENRELAPENRVALAIKNMPVDVLVNNSSQAVADNKSSEKK